MENRAVEFKNSSLSHLFPFKGSYLAHEGFTQHYLDIGEGEVIVMVHGNPTWSFYYRNLAKHFSEKFRVIVPDHKGCGFSTKPQTGDYSLAEHVKNLKSLLKHLNIKKFHLVAHDWGGSIGMGVATSCPEDVLSVTLFNTAAFPSTVIPKTIDLCRMGKIGEILVRQFNGFAWPATFMTTTKPLSKEVKQAYLFPYNNYKNRVAISRFVQDIPMEANHPTLKTLEDIHARLKDLKCKKQIIWGGKDFCFNDHFYKRWEEIYPEAQFHYFKDAGHYVIEDEKENVLSLMDTFYASL
jgi:pimeloyl-ACP methyl ester carboxylesterase